MYLVSSRLLPEELMILSLLYLATCACTFHLPTHRDSKPFLIAQRATMTANRSEFIF